MQSPLKILVVDDTPEDRELVRRYLTRGTPQRYTLLEAETGTEGLRIWREEQPDCTLLDFNLPDMNGLEFLSALLDMTHSEALPVVMLTGTGNEEIAVSSMRRGAQDYLVKGAVNAETVRASIRHAVDRVRMLERLAAQREELERTNQELLAADERKDQFLAMLAHELRNPVSAIRNAVEIIKIAPDDPGRVDHAMEVLERQLRHQSHILDDLLDVSRITRGKVLLRRERVDLNAVARETAEDAEQMLEKAGVRVRVDTSPDPVWVQGDRVRLAQVVGNLLHNAAKFTDQGGDVTVCVKAEGDRAVLTVQDSGIGINPEMLPYLFDTFAQADNSLDRTAGGLGLGLALVRGLVELHGGTVRAESAGLQRGAAFTISLPLYSGPEDPGARVSEPEDNGPFRILLIEDNRDAAETLHDLLELNGHEVDLAFSGPAGVEKARALCPDVVLCDIGLPGMDGYSVARELRRTPELSGLRLIAVTGYGQEEARNRAAEAGFDFHLTKPVEPPQLERLLRMPRPG